LGLSQLKAPVGGDVAAEERGRGKMLTTLGLYLYAVGTFLLSENSYKSTKFGAKNASFGRNLSPGHT